MPEIKLWKYVYIQAFKTKSEAFGQFFWRVMEISLLDEGVSIQEQNVLLVFLIHCFNSLVTITIGN